MSDSFDPPSANRVANTDASAANEANVQITHVIYALYAIGLITGGLTTLIGLIMAYVKLDDVKASYLESHFSWLIRTFWWSLLWFVVMCVVGFVLTIVTLGLAALLWWIPVGALTVWFIYRVVRGWLRLTEKSVP